MLGLRCSRRSWASRVALVLLGALVLSPARAAAWTAGGHVAIALLAYDALTPARRAALVQLLRAHPRFEQDLVPALPASLPSEARDRWLFGVAATWPDLARGQPLFDRGSWHYVNLPLHLRGGRLVSCQRARQGFLDAERRRPEGSPASIREALPDSARTLAEPSAPPPERALALSWVLHLVGDAHQPLHAVALFTSHRFRSGDRGGNELQVRDLGSLHRVWDDALVGVADVAAVEALVRELGPGLPREPAPPGAGLALERWLDESCELARDAVYTPPVLRAVEHAGATATPQLTLPPEYLRRAHRSARQRARQAASRLATFLARLPL